MLPKVTVITPSTGDRHEMLKRCVQLFKAQDYPNKELCIADTGMLECLMDIDNNIWHWESKCKLIGEKRNELCSLAKGGIIVHMDSDDLYAPDWLTRCVQELQDKPCTGLRQIYIHDLPNDKAYLYSYPDFGQLYLAEATLAYRKSHWEKHPHFNHQTGESAPLYVGAKAHDYIHGFMATIHGGNTTTGSKTGNYWREVDKNIADRWYI